MKNLLLVLFLSVPLAPTALAQAKPNVDDLLASARQSAALQKQDLKGILRKGKRKIPIALFLNRQAGNIQFQVFGAAQQWEKFHLRLKQDHFELFEINGGKTVRFPAAKLGQPIEGTDLTYEDLAMRFLYWKGGKVLGSQKVGVSDCWKIRLTNPGTEGRYKFVDVAVHKKFGALMRVTGYDFKGHAIKKFEISEIMQVDGVATLRVMRVDTIQPVSGKVIGLTRVEFDNPEGPKVGRPGSGFR